MHLGKPLGAITISAGVASFPQNASFPSQLMAKADAALYQAKKEGRDRTSVADDVRSDILTVENSGAGVEA